MVVPCHECVGPKALSVADIQDVGYWVAKIQSEVTIHPFIVAYGYQENIEKLIRYYRQKRSPYKNWVFPVNLAFLQQRGQDKPEPAKAPSRSPRGAAEPGAAPDRGGM